MAIVTVRQLLRPDGRGRDLVVVVNDEIADKAGDMVLSAEVLGANEVAIYAWYPDEPEEAEFVRIANNGPGPASPVRLLEEVICAKYAARRFPTLTQVDLWRKR